ncbi:MAG: hypothetical protein JEY99_20960 [Spirochaetales bacterium]|nr:hypothetical protein [Spirochaetales bacterium]
MKKRILIIILLITVCFYIFSEDELKPRIGILNFTAKSVSVMDAEAVGEIFTSELVLTDKFDIVDRQNIKNILEEMDFQLSGCTDSSCAVEVGQILSLEYMIYGSVIKLGELFSINVQMINVETAQIEHTGKEKFTSIEEAYDVIPGLVSSFVSTFGLDISVIPEEELFLEEVDNGNYRLKRNMGITSFFSGVVFAGASVAGFIFTNNYTPNVTDAYEDYKNADYLTYEELKNIYLDELDVRNSRLYLSIGAAVLGGAALTAGAILWFGNMDRSNRRSDSNISFAVYPGYNSVCLSFIY